MQAATKNEQKLPDARPTYSAEAQTRAVCREITTHTTMVARRVPEIGPLYSGSDVAKSEAADLGSTDPGRSRNVDLTGWSPNFDRASTSSGYIDCHADKLQP